jgi:outer membrane receptor protein involved in Fe transport
MRAALRLLTLTGLLLGGLASNALAQQQTGRVVGQVYDAESGRALQGVQVFVTGTSFGALAGLDGRYIISNVPAGTVSVTAMMIGFASKTVTGVVVPAGGAIRLDITLATAAVELEEITVSATAERGSVSGALNEMRTAVTMLSAISSEEITRSPDSDAAAAIRRVSGVTVQDGKYVFVRGLGERYTTTALNGARLPSPEPERKVVPLDLFPTSLLQTITTSKTFTPNLSGDFTGAQVDIRLRDFPQRRTITISGSVSGTTEATTQDILMPGDRAGWLAMTAGDRELPVEVERWGNFAQNPGPADVNRMVSSFRNAWSARSVTGTPGGSFSASVGGSDPLLFGHELGYLISGTYSFSEDAKVEHVRAQALAGDAGSVLEVDRFDGTTGTRSILWGGVGSFGTRLGDNHRLTFDASYNRTADDEARLEEGFSENLGQEFQIERLSYVERAVHSLQLGGEHQLGGNNRIDWTVTRSGVLRLEPDRSEIVYQIPGGGAAPVWFSSSNEGAVRTFSSLTGDGLEASLNHRLSWGDASRPHELGLGGLFSRTDRESDAHVYAVGSTLDQASRALEPEEIFDGRFTQGGTSPFRITPLSQGGSYTAEDELLAGYGMLTLQMGAAELIAGARVERSELVLDAVSTVGDRVGVNPVYTDVLPSVTLNWRFSDAQSLRIAATQTLSRPEYRELANVQYREVLGGDNIIGNPDLKRALVKNADVRWEWYPSPVEAISVGLFAKRFEDPIERVYLATSGTRIVTFQNAESAENYGVELEVRKGLGAFSPALEPWTVFSNATIMKSTIKIGGQGSSRSNDERPMEGQSPYVVNAGITYSTEDARTSATLLFNAVGRRISSAAEAPLPDVYEEARATLDLSLRFGLTEAVSGKLDLKNLLDSPYEFSQGTVLREYYRTGRGASLGLSWRP